MYLSVLEKIFIFKINIIYRLYYRLLFENDNMSKIDIKHRFIQNQYLPVLNLHKKNQY